MPKRSIEATDFRRLKRSGFEFEAPVDEYSAQPDSGSTTGGTIGMQEYGIAGGIATEDVQKIISHVDADQDLDFDELPDLGLEPGLEVEPSGGLSEWSAKHGLKEEETIENADDSLTKLEERAAKKKGQNQDKNRKEKKDPKQDA